MSLKFVCRISLAP